MPHSLASHAAPAVRYPVRRSLWLARSLIFCALSGGLTLLAWGWQGTGSRQHGLPLAFAVGFWLVGCMLAWRFWANGVCGVLAWNGQEWTLEALPQASAVVGTLAVHLDLQSHLWLRWQSGAGDAHWLWLERHRARERWGDLRRAVYSRAGTPAADALQPASPRDHSA